MITWHTACPNNATCIQIAHDGSRTLVRDSKDPDGPVLVFDLGEWTQFVEGVKAGVFDWTLDADREAAL